MHRRQFHIRTAVAAVSVIATTGCAQLLGDLNIADASITSPAAGLIRMTVLVENTSPLLQSATLVARVTIGGGETYTQQREISVQGNSSRSYEFEFTISQEEIPTNEVKFSAEIR